MIDLAPVVDLVVRIVSIPYRVLSQFQFTVGEVTVSLWHLAVSTMLIGIVVSLFVRSGKA